MGKTSYPNISSFINLRPRKGLIIFNKNNCANFVATKERLVTVKI